MIKSILRTLMNELNKLKFQNKNVRFLKGSKIDDNCFFEGNNSIGEYAKLNNCHFGFGSYTGYNVILNSVKIGRFCSIASNIHNTLGNHPTSHFVSTHPSFFSKGKAAGFTFTDKQLFTELNYINDNFLVDIGNDVWIGDNVIILDNVRIGDGAIIGANSLVTKNIEPYSINVGTPSKIIRYRFDKETIYFLLRFKWWEKEFAWLKDNHMFFSDINTFRKKFENFIL